MKYYYYGSGSCSTGELGANEMQHESPPVRRYGELVIEEDTIYEIDEACLNCQKKRKKSQ